MHKIAISMAGVALVVVSGCASVQGKLGFGGSSSGGSSGSSSAPAGHGAAVASKILPARLVSFIQARFEGNVPAIAAYTALFERSTRAFEKSWTGYQARKLEVDQAIVEADALVNKGAYREAAARLMQELSPLPLTEEGLVSRRRQMVESRDAEVPLILAALRLLPKSEDYASLYPLLDALEVRRRIGENRGKEQWLWYGYRNRRELSNLGHAMTPETVKFIDTVGRDADAAVLDGARIANGVLERPEDVGVLRARLTDHGAAKPGQWIITWLSPKDVQGTRAQTKFNDVQKIPTSCVEDRTTVVGIDFNTGLFMYGAKCQYRTERSHYTLDARLTAAADWVATLESYQPVALVGKVKKKGPKWDVRDAVLFRRAPTEDLGAHGPWVPDEGERLDALEVKTYAKGSSAR